MQMPSPLTEGRLIKRYKRFLADVELAGGEIVTALCPNPGSMIGLNVPGAPVWLSWSDNPKRKLPYTWELMHVDGGLVGMNTNVANRIAEHALEEGRIEELAGYDSLRREVRYGENSRIDFLLEAEGRPACYLEVKNVHLRRSGKLAEFPDSVTKRGTKHLHELTAVAERGERAVMLYIVQRMDCETFDIARDIDPVYDEALVQARRAGVEAYCYRCNVTLDSISVAKRLPILQEV